MQEPSNFNLSVAATLAHVNSGRIPSGFQMFWTRWRESVDALNPRIIEAREQDPIDPTGTHEIESIGSVRIGCRLLRPPADRPTRAGLVALHGYAQPGPMDEQERRWTSLAMRGVAVLVMRVRGYPGSTLDAGDLTAWDEGWLGYGLETPVDENTGQTGWVLSGAIADVVCAVRALRALLKDQTPVFIQGESFGGGLAVIASAQLGRDAPERLAIGLPSLGDWPWRLSHVPHPIGAAADVHSVMVRNAADHETLERSLRFFDTALHAPDVRGAVLCKLAERDEVVPAPSAAAVFNALRPSPRDRWRFVTGYGHFDGGIADVRRHALFERAVSLFLDPDREPDEGLNEWIKCESDRLNTSPLTES